MKVVFLDFDGPLVPFAKKYQKRRPAMASKDAVDNLNVLLRESGAKIVVSSSWRKLQTIEQLQKLLTSWGVIGEVVGKTPSIDSVGPSRGKEIQSWLESHPGIESYVIIDDEDSDMHPLKDHVAKTMDRLVGTQPVDVSLALMILELPPV